MNLIDSNLEQIEFLQRIKSALAGSTDPRASAANNKIDAKIQAQQTELLNYLQQRIDVAK